jgi:hypothetical protein
MTTTRAILLAAVVLAGMGSYTIGDADAAPLHRSEETFVPAIGPKSHETDNVWRDPCSLDPESCGRVGRGPHGSIGPAPGSVGEAFRLGAVYRVPPAAQR